jgi:EAL domain-containing protein (putative c-di-GMP-specific phosphodiesterase class I)
MSIGVSFADSTTPASQLVSEADSAMYEVKSNGKNRVEVFQPSMRSRLVDRLEMTSGFRGSLQRSEFFLEYQPIYSLDDRTVCGFEALVRWRHPTLGLVPPLNFIPIAEETGFIVPLGRWVLMEACGQLAALSQPRTSDVVISVNVSRRQLIVPQFVDDVRAALALSGLTPRQLVLEVTEGILMENPDKAAAALAALQHLGVRIAVDDFGTGYSSLSHLQRFPVDILKIDKSFVGPLNQVEPESSALVSSIIGLARGLGLQIVAEGIEREDQLDVLLGRDCTYGQGYLLSRPLDHGAVSELIATLQSSRGSRATTGTGPS